MSEGSGFRFLPLCTVVRVEDRGDGLFAVIARAVVRQQDGMQAVYQVMRVPEGNKSDAPLPVVFDDQITEIVHGGYAPDSDGDVLQEKIAAAKKAPARKPREDIPEPILTNALQQASRIVAADEEDPEVVREKMRKNPFYKLMKLKEEGKL